MRQRSWLVWLWVAFVVAVVLADFWLGSSLHPLLRVYGAVIALVLPVCGALVVWKRPRNRIGWLLLLGGFYFPAQAVFSLLRPLASGELELWAAWGQQVFWATSIPPMVTFVPLLFPDGRLPSRRWRWAAWTAAIGVAGLTVGNALSPDLSDGLRNPAAFAGTETAAPVVLGIGAAAFVAAFLAAVASVVMRFRRSRGIERLQLRWLVLGVSAAFGTWVVAVTLEAIGKPAVGGWIFGAGFTLIPVAVAVAVLRYRLYDIDRIVSRALVYVGVTAVLAAVYVAVTLIPQMWLWGMEGDSPDLLVAGATLAAAALFRPVRQRVQSFVDRRFYRSRYDARRTVEEFSARLRDQVELAALVDELGHVAASTVKPARFQVWLPAHEHAR